LGVTILFLGVWIDADTAFALGRATAVLVLALLFHQLSPHQQVKQKAPEWGYEGD